MLIAALGLTIVGFVALVLSIATGNIVFAWVCIAAGVLGVVLIIADAITSIARRRKRNGTKDVDSRRSQASESTEHQ